MRHMESVIPSIAVVLLLVVATPFNIRCQLFFPQQSTVPLAFSFGWPISYLSGNVPGSGQLIGIGPNFVWGHPEFNDDPKIMQSYRQQLSGVSLTPWNMHRYGQFHITGFVFNTLLLLCVGPILWWYCRLARLDKQNRIRFNGFAKGGKVQIQTGGFKNEIGTVEAVEIEKDQISVLIQISGHVLTLHFKPEELENA